MDPNAGKYDKIYSEEFDMARHILSDLDGELRWSEHDYQAFVFRGPKVSLVFYPHKTSSLNYHIRVRDQGSADKNEAAVAMKKLDEESGYNCTFTKGGR